MWIYVTRVDVSSEDCEDIPINTDCVAVVSPNLQRGAERLLLVMADGSDMLIDCTVENIIAAFRPGTFTDLRAQTPASDGSDS